MLYVKINLANSKIHGNGLFAAQFIPKGTVVQKFVPGIDLEITQEQIDQLSQTAQTQIYHYSYKHKKTGNWILCADDARFLNHSLTPNLVSNSLEEEVDVAGRDIEEGEELTVNYYDFDDDATNKLSKI